MKFLNEYQGQCHDQKKRSNVNIRNSKTSETQKRSNLKNIRILGWSGFWI